jgi:UDP-galactopyranose mutase
MAQETLEIKEKYDIVIVGAGISGLTLAERYASLGKKVLVVEGREHIGGNCYDFYNEHGILVAKYGPHYFRTNYEDIWEYVNRFSKWKPFEARIICHIDGKKVPLPICIHTINTYFGTALENEGHMEEWLAANTSPIVDPQNAEDAALGRVGPILYEKIFKEYTMKQWGKHPRELHPEVTNRIPVRNNHDDRYFTDVHQAIPTDGYTKLFENMIAKGDITIMLNTSWESVKDTIEPKEKLFFTGRIDSYFEKKFGALEYRSLRFEFETLDQEYYQEFVQENYPSLDYPFTRIVEYKRMTGQQHPKTTISREYPTWEGEPYYPVPSDKNKATYALYQTAAEALEKKGIYFVGRLANYKYFNMDQAFKNALDLFYKLEGGANDSLQ